MVVFAALSSAETLDVAGFLERVEQNSRDLQIARKDVALADTDIRAAWSSVFPSVGGQAGYIRNLSPLYTYQGGSKTELTGDNNQFQVGVSATQKLVDFLALSGIRAAREYRSLSGELYEAQRTAILTMARKMFYQVLLLEEIYQVRRLSEENAFDNFLDVQRKYENGVVSQLAVLQAEVA
jgi:outer membrane protein TolC